MGLVEFRLALGWKVVHDMMLPALFLDRPKLELRESYKSLSLFCRGSGNPDDERPTGILVWHRSQVRLWFARTGTLTLYRSPYTVHTRKSLSSTALGRLTMVSSMSTATLAVVDAREKGPIGGCMVCLYCIVLTQCRLDTRHQ